MKFLIKSMGWDGFRAAFDDAFAAIRAEGGRPLKFESEPPESEAAPDLGACPRHRLTRSPAGSSGAAERSGHPAGANARIADDPS
jgi:hypothetical protein